MVERLGSVDTGPLFLTTARCGDQVLGSPAPRDLVGGVAAEGWSLVPQGITALRP